VVYYCLLYNKFEFAGIFISKLNIYTVFRDILSIWQMHILLSRTAQISLKLHFCVELHSKKALVYRVHAVDLVGNLVAVVGKCMNEQRAVSLSTAFKETTNTHAMFAEMPGLASRT